MCKGMKLVMPGVICIEIDPFTDHATADIEINALCKHLESQSLSEIPLLVIADNAAFTAETLNNFIWVTFTRSNPSHDVYGLRSSHEFKHWGCEPPLIIDARIKPHHAPPLIEDPNTSSKVDAMAARGGPISRYL